MKLCPTSGNAAEEAASGPLGKSEDDRHSVEPNILL